jgi:hypothetical protein
MRYYLDLFSPETYKAFGHSDRLISGFTQDHSKTANGIRPGDKLVCYMTKLSRWVGLLEVLDGPFRDENPIFCPEPDPYVIRFHVKPQVWLPMERTIPISDATVWDHLSFTRGQEKRNPRWSLSVRRSLVPITDEDGQLIESLLLQQAQAGKAYPLDPDDFRKLSTHKVRRADKDVIVTVPDDKDDEAGRDKRSHTEVRESIQVQALLADMGHRMGMQVWLPRGDRGAVLSEWKGDHSPPIERLPLNYDETTLKTIEQIDVLWLRGRSIRRAFEVEHTTSVYSGILRMADLLALQPNMEIKLHIVAPVARREKVMQELRRPVFSLLERGPLSETCTYLSYDSIRELAQQPNLAHMKETVLNDYEEEAEE